MKSVHSIAQFLFTAGLIFTLTACDWTQVDQPNVTDDAENKTSAAGTSPEESTDGEVAGDDTVAPDTADKALACELFLSRQQVVGGQNVTISMKPQAASAASLLIDGKGIELSLDAEDPAGLHSFEIAASTTPGDYPVVGFVTYGELKASCETTLTVLEAGEGMLPECSLRAAAKDGVVHVYYTASYAVKGAVLSGDLFNEAQQFELNQDEALKVFSIKAPEITEVTSYDLFAQAVNADGVSADCDASVTVTPDGSSDPSGNDDSGSGTPVDTLSCKIEPDTHEPINSGTEITVWVSSPHEGAKVAIHWDEDQLWKDTQAGLNLTPVDEDGSAALKVTVPEGTGGIKLFAVASRAPDVMGWKDCEPLYLQYAEAPSDEVPGDTGAADGTDPTAPPPADGGDSEPIAEKLRCTIEAPDTLYAGQSFQAKINVNKGGKVMLTKNIHEALRSYGTSRMRFSSLHNTEYYAAATRAGKMAIFGSAEADDQKALCVKNIDVLSSGVTGIKLRVKTGQHRDVYGSSGPFTFQACPSQQFDELEGSTVEQQCWKIGETQSRPHGTLQEFTWENTSGTLNHANGQFLSYPDDLQFFRLHTTSGDGWLIAGLELLVRTQASEADGTGYFPIYQNAHFSRVIDKDHTPEVRFSLDDVALLFQVVMDEGPSQHNDGKTYAYIKSKWLNALTVADLQQRRTHGAEPVDLDFSHYETTHKNNAASQLDWSELKFRLDYENYDDFKANGKDYYPVTLYNAGNALTRELRFGFDVKHEGRRGRDKYRFFGNAIGLSYYKPGDPEFIRLGFCRARGSVGHSSGNSNVNSYVNTAIPNMNFSHAGYEGFAWVPENGFYNIGGQVGYGDTYRNSNCGTNMLHDLEYSGVRSYSTERFAPRPHLNIWSGLEK